MDLRSLLQDVLSEVSSEVISFQIELHSLITRVKSSGLFRDYRNFEDMHHGIKIDWRKNLNGQSFVEILNMAKSNDFFNGKFRFPTMGSSLEKPHRCVSMDH